MFTETVIKSFILSTKILKSIKLALILYSNNSISINCGVSKLSSNYNYFNSKRNYVSWEWINYKQLASRTINLPRMKFIIIKPIYAFFGSIISSG